MLHYSSHYTVKPHDHYTLKHPFSFPCCEQCCDSCCYRVKQRYLVASLTAIGITIQYMQRMCLSIMITDMVKATKEKKAGDFCPVYNGTFLADKERNPEFNWDVPVQGELIAAFFYGYFITHIPGGIISDLFGGKNIFGVTSLLSSVCMALSPICARADVYFLLAIRVIMGLLQGPLFPSITTIVAHWSPPEERGLINTITNSGIPLGLVLGNLVTGQILYASSTWELPFYIYGGLGVVWFIFWMILVSPTPANHPFITDEEKDHILDSIQKDSKEPAGKIPWCEMLLSKEFIVTTIANLGHEASLFLIAAELPIYMFSVLRLPTGFNGLLTSIPWFFMWIGNMFFGNLSTILIKRKILSTKMVRKLFGGMANLIPAATIVGVVYLKCDYIAVTAVISVGTFFIGAVFCSIRASFLDMAPNYAGITMSIAASIGGIAGFVVPTFVHVLIGDGTKAEDWRSSFFIINGFLAVSTIPYLILINADVQPWNEGHLSFRRSVAG